MNIGEQIGAYENKKARALGMGGPEKLARRKSTGVLNARERIAHLTYEGSFLASGLFGFSSGNSADRNSTPADGKIAGYGQIEGREVTIVANDFTVKGASTSLTNGKKIAQMKRVATQRGIPAVFLGESSGARMPDTMGARGMGAMPGSGPTQYQRMRETPWAAAALGHCFGSSAARPSLGDDPGAAASRPLWIPVAVITGAVAGLEAFEIAGVKINSPALCRILQSQPFQAADIHTGITAEVTARPTT